MLKLIFLSDALTKKNFLDDIDNKLMNEEKDSINEINLEKKLKIINSYLLSKNNPKYEKKIKINNITLYSYSSFFSIYFNLINENTINTIKNEILLKYFNEDKDLFIKDTLIKNSLFLKIKINELKKFTDGSYLILIYKF